MAKVANRSNNGTKPESIDFFTVLIVSVLSLVMFYTPYLQGLYFEKDQYPTEILVLGVLLIFWIKRIVSNRKAFMESLLEYAAFSFFIVYFISLFAAASLRAALSEWMKYCMYFSVFFMMSEVMNSYRRKRAMLWVMAISAMGVCLLGIDSALDSRTVNLLNALFKLIGCNFSFFGLYVDGRIHSTFQYPNTLAAYLLVVFFIATVLSITSSRKWTKVAAGICSTFYVATGILTISRGVYLLFPLGLLLFILTLPRGYKVKGAIYSIGAAISGLTVTGFFYLLKNSNSINCKMLLILAIAILSAAAINLLLGFTGKFFEKLSVKAYLIVFSVFIVFAVSFLLFLINSTSPLNFFHSTEEENSYYVVTKTINLKPEKEYKLLFDARANNELKEPYAFFIEIYAKDVKDIISKKSKKIAAFSKGETNGMEQHEVYFKVPENMPIVDIKFINYYRGTFVTFDNAKVVDAQSEKTIKKITLKYKYFNNILSRFESMTSNDSLIQRRIYFKDGFKMFKDKWLFGSGGGAWLQKYFYYQSYNYKSTQAHNFLLQIATDCGIVGVICFVLLLVAIAAAFLNEYRYGSNNGIGDRVIQGAIFTSVTVLIVHSLLDFDLSYAGVSLLMWALLAMFNARGKEGRNEERVQYRQKGIKKIIELCCKTVRVKPINLNPIVGLVISIFISVIPIAFVAGDIYSRKADSFTKQGDIDTAASLMKKAADIDIFKAEYKIEYAELLVSRREITESKFNEANTYIANAEKLSKYNYGLRAKIAEYYFGVGNIEKGLEHLEALVYLRPLSVDAWQQKVDVYYKLVMMNLNENKKDEALRYLDKAIGAINEAREKNKNNMAPFIFNAGTSEMLERLKYIEENINKSGQTDAEKIVFFSISDMDIDSDSIPDQWSIVRGENVKLGYNGSRLMLDAENGIVESRKLKFRPNTNYRITIEFESLELNNGLQFTVKEITKEPQLFKQEKNVLYAEVRTPQGQAEFESTINIIVDGKMTISRILIEEV